MPGLAHKKPLANKGVRVVVNQFSKKFLKGEFSWQAICSAVSCGRTPQGGATQRDQEE